MEAKSYKFAIKTRRSIRRGGVDEGKIMTLSVSSLPLKNS